MSTLKHTILAAALMGTPWAALSSPAQRTAPASQPAPACVASAVPADYLIYHALATGRGMPLAPRRPGEACASRGGVRA